MTTIALQRLSLCECGFPALNEDVPLGKQYRVEEGLRVPITWTCGGCNKTRELEAVFVYPDPGAVEGGFLPVALFRPNN